ncbi:hypothetical protein C8Q74DRAFT_1367483 [Fomes fomentarius]|nr:hypothetical protein C8Q74DRAFT_1367483 [Fomes fomentarius]
MIVHGGSLDDSFNDIDLSQLHPDDTDETFIESGSKIGVASSRDTPPVRSSAHGDKAPYEGLISRKTSPPKYPCPVHQCDLYFPMLRQLNVVHRETLVLFQASLRFLSALADDPIVHNPRADDDIVQCLKAVEELLQATWNTMSRSYVQNSVKSW